MPQKCMSKELFKTLGRKHGKICKWHRGNAERLNRTSGDHMGNAASDAPESTTENAGSDLLHAVLQHPPAAAGLGAGRCRGLCGNWQPIPDTIRKAPLYCSHCREHAETRQESPIGAYKTKGSSLYNDTTGNCKPIQSTTSKVTPPGDQFRRPQYERETS